MPKNRAKEIFSRSERDLNLFTVFRVCLLVYDFGAVFFLGFHFRCCAVMFALQMNLIVAHASLITRAAPETSVKHFHVHLRSL